MARSPRPLTAGFCTLALFWFVYTRFDLLAVLTLQLSSGVVLSIFMLAQKGLAVGSLVSTLGGVLAIAFWFAKRGAGIPEGDPLATNPALTGFRAEREKLQAEFSVARRAQKACCPRRLQTSQAILLPLPALLHSKWEAISIRLSKTAGRPHRYWRCRCQRQRRSSRPLYDTHQGLAGVSQQG
jgi:hypothetical protein